jgi:hypothetical protein
VPNYPLQRTSGLALLVLRPLSGTFSVIIQRDAEGYYVASVPALRGCHTQATSLDELIARVRQGVLRRIRAGSRCET